MLVVGPTIHVPPQLSEGRNNFELGIYIVNLFQAYWLRDAPTCLMFNNCTLCPRCICVLYLSENRDLFHLQHKLIGFYNRDEKCLQRGTDWAFK